MLCCSRKIFFPLLGIAALIGLLIATGKVNPYVIVPFLPLLACPLMCVIMMMFGKCCKDKNGECRDKKKHS